LFFVLEFFTGSISFLKNFKFSFIFFPPTLHIYFLKKAISKFLFILFYC
jgi:hypothetical protein